MTAHDSRRDMDSVRVLVEVEQEEYPRSIDASTEGQGGVAVEPGVMGLDPGYSVLDVGHGLLLPAAVLAAHHFSYDLVFINELKGAQMRKLHLDLFYMSGVMTHAAS